MSIDFIKGGFSQIQGVAPITPPTAPKNPGTESAAAGSFGEMLTSAIKEVDRMQHDADKQIEGLMLQKEGVTTHSAMLALEKADTAFQLMNNIRAKIIRAYEEVMRTQV